MPGAYQKNTKMLGKPAGNVILPCIFPFLEKNGILVAGCPNVEEFVDLLCIGAVDLLCTTKSQKKKHPLLWDRGLKFKTELIANLKHVVPRFLKQRKMSFLEGKPRFSNLPK